MATAPCYDKVNHKDCPNRSWCKEVGRSKCEKWVEYEKAHAAELEARKKEVDIISACYDLNYRLTRKIKRRSR